jgi:hypothetical protein
LHNQLILLKEKGGIIDNDVRAREKKPPISDTSYSSLIRGPVATVGYVILFKKKWVLVNSSWLIFNRGKAN